VRLQIDLFFFHPAAALFRAACSVKKVYIEGLAILKLAIGFAKN